MAKSPKTGRSFKNLSAKDITKINRVTGAVTSSDEFGEAFAEDPALALAAKGIEITPKAADKIKANLDKLGGSPGTVASTEIGVTVKKSF